MKSHGMGLNSFNEYEWNSEFAGRNVIHYSHSVSCSLLLISDLFHKQQWNGGEIIELVLRKKDGRFLVSYLYHYSEQG
jgi:hypothetical protein